MNSHHLNRITVAPVVGITKTTESAEIKRPKLTALVQSQLEASPTTIHTDKAGTEEKEEKEKITLTIVNTLVADFKGWRTFMDDQHRCYDFIKSIAVDLSNLHKNGYVHGNPSLDMMLIDAKGAGKLMTSPAQVAVAPESLRCKHLFSQKSDVFHFAHTMVKLLTGACFTGNEIDVEPIQESYVDFLQEHPERIVQLFRSCLREDFRFRPSMEEVATKLSAGLTCYLPKKDFSSQRFFKFLPTRPYGLRLREIEPDYEFCILEKTGKEIEVDEIKKGKLYLSEINGRIAFTVKTILGQRGPEIFFREIETAIPAPSSFKLDLLNQSGMKEEILESMLRVGAYDYLMLISTGPWPRHRFELKGGRDDYRLCLTHGNGKRDIKINVELDDGNMVYLRKVNDRIAFAVGGNSRNGNWTLTHLPAPSPFTLDNLNSYRTEIMQIKESRKWVQKATRLDPPPEAPAEEEVTHTSPLHRKFRL